MPFHLQHTVSSLRHLSPSLQGKSAAGTTVEMDVDARPSDAINLAVRFGAPIFVSETVAKQCGVRTPLSPPQPAAASTSAVSPASFAGAAAAARFVRAPAKRLDAALVARMRMALAVAEGRAEDAARARDDVASALGGAASAHAVAAAALMLEVERAVAEERYGDAAQARDHLSVMNSFLDEDGGAK